MSKLPLCLLLLLLVAPLGCGPSLKTCHMEAGPARVDVFLYAAYHASSSGDGTLARLTYHSNEGEQTVSYPVLPWTQVVPLYPGKQLGMTADGTVTNGSLRIAFEASTQQGGLAMAYQGTDYCMQINTNH